MIVSSHPQIGVGVKFLNLTGQVAEAIKGYMELLSYSEVKAESPKS